MNIYFLLIYSRFPDVRVTFPSIERSMLRARRENQPAVPHSIADAVASMEANLRFRYVKNVITIFIYRILLSSVILLHYRMNRDGTKIFFRKHLSTPTGDALLFVSYDTVGELIGAVELHIDEIFRCVPSLFKQIVTIHSVKNGLVIIFIFFTCIL